MSVLNMASFFAENDVRCGNTKHKWRTTPLLVFMAIVIRGVSTQMTYADDEFVTIKTSQLTELPGGFVSDGQMVWRSDKGPYLLREDIIVGKDAELVVEPGVEVHFGPMIGITVLGKLTALGRENDKIVFTSADPPTQSTKPIPDIRLVDGPSILAGRVQILYKGEWRSVCTNSRNWTRADMETACRQLGFQGGSFYNWVDRQPIRKPRLLYEEPKCRGTELEITECDWNSRQLGSGVCDYHPDLGIECLPIHENDERIQTMRHWRGIRFENAPTENVLTQYNTLYIPTSLSSLSYVTIKYAGVGRNNNATSALDVFGVPPIMNYVEITNSAYNGINVTSPNGPIKISNCAIRNNRGYGIIINSTYGLSQIENCNITENGADGIRYIVHDINPDEKHDRTDIYDFCVLPITSGQTFPIQFSMEQSKYSNVEKDCEKYFLTRAGHVLTLNFIKLLTDRNESAVISVYDGNSADDKLLGSFLLRNHTRPQSITSTSNKIFIKFQAKVRSEILGFFKLTSGLTKTYDLNVSNSVITDNNGRGIAIENLRSQIHVHQTSISNNNHVAGLQVISGAGDVNVTESRISYNKGDGINITYTGGNRNISYSTLSSNNGHGIAVWLNDSKETEYIHFNQSTVIQYSEIFKNLHVGILHGNYCGDNWLNITGNWFNNSIQEAVEVSSCWFQRKENQIMRLQIGHNMFIQSQKLSIKIHPALNMMGRIEYNHFESGKFGAIYIKNLIENRLYNEFDILPVDLVIQHNHFSLNRGVFVVNLGVSPYSHIQNILFTRNFLRENKIKEPYEIMEIQNRLTPRSRVAAPVVISSSNVVVFRNILHNSESNYEIGSHLEDQSQIINCTYNWLGFSEESKIYNRIFHRKDRYNLAKIEYLPYLLHSSNPAASQINYNPMYVPLFNVQGSYTVGGEVDGIEVLKPGDYVVERDINIRPGGKLVLQPGVKLNFPPAIGVMVAGKLDARGKSPNDITFTLKQEIVMTNDNTTYETDTEQYESETPEIEVEPLVPVRLLGGKTPNEGRLQVRINSQWGTVCDYRWTMINAALVCRQLGLVLNPDDWYLEKNQIPNAGTTEKVILSNVECTEFDYDITKCKAEQLDDFENSCTHEQDVGIKCYDVSWAGLRFSVLSERADLQFINVEKAGLLDHATNTFKPALQIDFARHSLESVRISDNFQDGLGILYSDLYSADAVNTVKNSEFSNNKGNGISFKQLGLKIHNSYIENNNLAGIYHDQRLTGIQQRELSGWFNMASDFNIVDSNYHPIMIPDFETNISLENGETRYIVTTKLLGKNVKKIYNITCKPGYVIGIQLLNPIQNYSTENILIYDSQSVDSAIDIWHLKRDLSVFPTTSSSFGIVLTYESGESALGGVVVIVSTVLAPVQDIKNRIVKGAIPSLTVKSSKIKGNARGLHLIYYNSYLNEIGDHFLRKANESVKLINCEIAHNKEEAIFVHTPLWDIHESNITEITLMINNSLITDNGKGIYQFSRDMRSSNNLFHYVLQDNSIERNQRGGFEINLPYVWQYNENFTHSVYLDNNTWRLNEFFGMTINGHYASVNITKNVFSDNNCKTGLISISGMEKSMKIKRNRIERNNGKFMVEFKADSQSEILGEVKALFINNNIRFNKYASSGHGFRMHQLTTDPTFVVGFDGIQKVKIKRNLLVSNSLDYNLVAGVLTAKIDNYLDVAENYWGYSDNEKIKKSIFDFDDWNNYALAKYLPYLLEDSFESSLSVSYEQANTQSGVILGGRLTQNMTLYSKDTPYIIESDITIMPGVTLIIYPRVVMEFMPNVGILVLGSLIAQGRRGEEIIMKPYYNIGNIESNNIEKRHTAFSSEKNSFNKQRRQLENLIVQDSIRLCTDRNCSVNEYVINKTNEGFLEYYNRTTLQWVPMCDKRFTERNAQVVCRELGYDPINAYFDHDYRIEFHSNSLSRIWSWPEPLQCKGTESRYEDCPVRLNGQLYGHRHECKWNSKFVFIHCGSRNLDNNQDYWGGVRFANSEFEYNLYEHRIHDAHTHETVKRTESVMEHVHVIGAGVLHNEKSPAVQSILKSPRINFVNVSRSAYHGIHMFSPSENIKLMFNEVGNSLGVGTSIVTLTGEGRESDESSFTPLKSLDMPYNMFSVINICDTTKEITIEERVLLYYKYDNNPVSCVKIFNSMYRVKPFGIRFLQFNLFNHSEIYGKHDSVTIYDGDIYNISAPIIATLENGSPLEKKLFKSTGPSISMKIFTNGASSVHGFIAEVVTLPISAIGFGRDIQHNISFSVYDNNRQGAISYHSVGEVNPIITMDKNRFINNCEKLYGNFSTCQASVNLDIQNTQSLYFRSNLVQGNEGGLSIRADSRGTATSLKGWIHNNLFYDNHNLPALKVEGRQSSPYQEVIIYRNYFTRNKTPYKDVIVLRQVVSNFTMNYVHSNTGQRILEVSGFDRVRLPIYQTTSHNGFYKNYALNIEGRATVIAGTAGQHYIHNIFFNPDNDYEMITVNKSLFIDTNANQQSNLDFWRTRIDAAHNYWGYNETWAVSGRIRDRSDNPELLEVEFKPFYMNNKTVLNGKCPPGWDLVGDTCYMYVGAPMTFREAKEFCSSDNASLPYISSNYFSLWQFLRMQNQWYQFGDKVWVQHIDHIKKCTMFTYQTVEVDDCQRKNSFICEIDPKILIDPLSWTDDVVTVAVIGVLGAAILFVVLVIFCWYSKSKHRHIQRLERRNSIRQSMHSLASINGGFSDSSYRRKAALNNRSTDTLTKSSDYKKMLSSAYSMDSVEKNQFNSSIDDNQSYDVYEAHNPNPLVAKPVQHSTFKKESPKYSLPITNSNPLFDLTYRNDGFKDTSTLASHNPSMNTLLTEETPIIHHREGDFSQDTSYRDEDTLTPHSDLQYYNSDTLPLRSNLGKSDDTLDIKQEIEDDNKYMYKPYGTPTYGQQQQQPKLSFLTELRHKMPEAPPKPQTQPTSFGQRKNIAGNKFYEDNLPSPPLPSHYEPLKNNIAPAPAQFNGNSSYASLENTRRMPKSKSKSEALLETNFDLDDGEINGNGPYPISEANRSHSQPLETSM